MITQPNRSSSALVQHSPDAALKDYKPSVLMQEMVEGFIDGVLILTEQGKVLCANTSAREICRQLMRDVAQVRPLPQQIWHICEQLIDSRSVLPDYLVSLEDEIVSGSAMIRVRARWLKLPTLLPHCMMVTLEDRQQSIHNSALAEARRYRLTARETEVWLLKRTNYTYKAIAAKLHIAIDTVKKHIKEIHRKREASQWEDA